MEQQVREPQGGETIIGVILRRAEKHVQNSVFRELLQINILGKKQNKTNHNFIGFALRIQNKNCTEMELIENKLSREQMPTIYHSGHEKWCREASMTKQRGMEAIASKKAFFKKLEKMEKVINPSRLNIQTEESRQKRGLAKGKKSNSHVSDLSEMEPRERVWRVLLTAQVWKEVSGKMSP